MNIADLLAQKVGKRMAAFCWSVWMIGQTEDFSGKIIIAALAVVYLACQTISDRRKAGN